jgi:DNA-binding GntR family transcriptional regulator
LTIAEQVRKQISSGKLPKGSSLPSEAKFSEQHGIGRSSARKVLAELERDGLVYSVPGQGWIVGSAADRSKAPTPREIAGALRADLESGAFPAGAAFVTAPEVCKRFGVTLHPARRALALLEDAGLIVSVHGKGRFVAPLTS